MPEKLKNYQQKKAAGYFDKPQFEASSNQMSQPYFTPV
jgi:hypothetical protein